MSLGRFKVHSFFPFLIILISGSFILKIVIAYYQQIVSSLNSLTFLSLFTSSGCFLAYYYLRAIAWHTTLRTLHQKPLLRFSAFNFFSGEAMRYIPGNIWSFIGRGYLTAKQKIPKSVILVAFGIEIFSLLLAATILSLPVLGDNLHRFPNYSLILLGIASSLALIACFYFRKKLTIAILKLNQLENQKKFSQGLVQILAYHLLAWFMLGLGTYILMLQLNPAVPFITFISIPIFAWLIGYISIISPMGLGIREGVLIALLSSRFTIAQATVIALLSRTLLITVETVNISAWLYYMRRDLFKQALVAVLKRWDLAVLIIMVLIYTITFSNLSILRHDAFASNYDLANMGQTVWNTFHGRPFQLSGAEGTVSRFSIHADIILILLSPLYFIWERIYMLLVIQSLALGLGAVPVYFISRKILGSKFVSLSLSLVYLLNPSLEWTNIYDFHGVALAIPFLLSSFYFALVKKWKWFWVFTLLALTTKEEISLLIAGLGIVIFFVFKNKFHGSMAFFTGILWFLIVTFIIIPFYSPDGQHWGVEGLYDTAIGKIINIRNLSQLTDVFRGYFLTPSAVEYYTALIKPFSFISLLGFPWILLALPEFAINLFSTNRQMQTTTFHYDSGITPFLVIATIYGLSYLFLIVKRIPVLESRSRILLNLIAIFMVAVAIRVNYHYSPLPTTPSCWCLSYQVTQEDRDFLKVLATIPKNASVASSGEVRAHLTRWENSFTLPGHAYDADYVAILDQSRIVGDYLPKEFETSLVKDPKFLSTHELKSHIGHFYLFKKTSLPSPSQ